jgi:hypothetical protein
VPWQSGEYYLFSKLLILTAAPDASGVFGLYRVRNHVFISESANIRAALLRLHADMERFGFTSATGFTFELCPPGSRVKRLREILAEYRCCGCSETDPNIVVYG